MKNKQIQTQFSSLPIASTSTIATNDTFQTLMIQNAQFFA